MPQMSEGIWLATFTNYDEFTSTIHSGASRPASEPKVLPRSPEQTVNSSVRNEAPCRLDPRRAAAILDA
ncbi:hypothetical protein BRAS3843_700002 [Bradyrhizobium sp. STM 3843]|nr:hypothetical protein BRAS3843_700002 [Bradyrhizobium sp. STM 3843]